MSGFFHLEWCFRSSSVYKYFSLLYVNNIPLHVHTKCVCLFVYRETFGLFLPQILLTILLWTCVNESKYSNKYMYIYVHSSSGLNSLKVKIISPYFLVCGIFWASWIFVFVIFIKLENFGSCFFPLLFLFFKQSSFMFTFLFDITLQLTDISFCFFFNSFFLYI